MEEVSIIGVDLAKNVFQLHGAGADGAVVFRKKLSRQQFARFMADHSACDVAMVACPSAHHWTRELTAHGHRVRLIAPHYVKPFIKRQKNDAADAEAIAEAATCAHHGDPATDSMNIRPPIPQRSGHRFHEHPATLV